MHGTVSVNKLRGNFHFSAGKAYVHGGSHIHDMSSFIQNQYGQNFIHEINHLQFGTHEYNTQKQKRTKSTDIVNPLDATKWGAANRKSFKVTLLIYCLLFISFHDVSILFENRSHSIFIP